MRLLFTFLLVITIHFQGIAQSPPEQPRRGPGGLTYPHGETRVTQYGSDITNWYWIIEPVDPKPDSSEVVVFFHGTNSNLDSTKLLNGQELFCRHIAQKGYTVIYPLYQYGGQTLPFGPQLSNAAEVIQLALNRLDSDPNHAAVKRWPNGKIKWATTGISRGGGMSLNIAAHHDLLNLPDVDAIVAFVPGSGRRHQHINPNSKVVIVSAEEDETNGPKAAHNAHQEAWDSLYRHPCSNREYFIVHSDDHGTPNIVAKHDCHGSGNDWNNRFRLNTLDFNGSWKWSVGTFNCMFRNQDCNYVFGKDSVAIYMGRWSDGQLVNPSNWVDPCTTTSHYNLPDIYGWSIYPNPGRNTISIKSETQFSLVEIFDHQGRKLLQTDHKEINTSGLENGIFIIRMTYNDGSVENKKWVKI